MKPNNLFPFLTACLLLSGAVATSNAQQRNLSAQEAGSGQRSGTPALAPALGPIANVLTEEQRASLRKNMAAQREQNRGLEIQLREARSELLRASVNRSFDEQNIRARAVAVARIEAQLAVMRARAISQIQPPLSAEQVEKIMNSLPAAGRRGTPALNGRSNAGGRRGPANTTNRDENNLPPKQ